MPIVVISIKETTKCQKIFVWRYYTYRLYDMGFINWHNFVNKKSHVLNLVSVILPEKIQMTKKWTFCCFFYADNNNSEKCQKGSHFNKYSLW